MASNKLRAVYDALDQRDYKQALHLANNVLKKQGDNLTAQALRALALVKSNPDPAEGIAAADAVAAKRPTDESVLNALLYVYKAADMTEKMTPLYVEAAKKNPTNEELVVAAFLSHVRDGASHAAQQQAAADLFTRFAKPKYMFWRATSLFLQGKAEGNTKLIMLCEMLLRKAMADGRFTSFKETDLFLDVLEIMGKHSEIPSLLADNGPLAKFYPLKDLRQERTATAFIKLGQLAEARKIYEALLHTPDANLNWLHFMGYLDSAFAEKETPERTQAIEASRKLFEELRTAHPENRGPQLAIVELEKRLNRPAQVLEEVVSFAKTFVQKSCCASDLRPYITFLVKDGSFQPADILAKISPEASTTQVDNASIRLLIFHTQIQRMLGLQNAFSDAELKAKAEEIIEVHERSFTAFPPTGSAAPHFSDDLLILAFSMFVDLSRRTKDRKVLVEAAAWLERSIGRNDNNFQVRLCLIELYKELGDAQALLQHFHHRRMSIKNILLENLGSLVLDSTIRLCSFDGASKLMDAILAIHLEHSVQIPDFIIQAFVNETYAKVPELAAFRKKMQKSSLLAATRTQKQMLQLVRPAAGSSLMKTASSLDINSLDIGDSLKDLETHYDVQLPAFKQWEPVQGDSTSVLKLAQDGETGASCFFPTMQEQASAIKLERIALRIAFAASNHTENLAQEIQSFTTALATWSPAGITGSLWKALACTAEFCAECHSPSKEKAQSLSANAAAAISQVASQVSSVTDSGLATSILYLCTALTAVIAVLTSSAKQALSGKKGGKKAKQAPNTPAEAKETAVAVGEAAKGLAKALRAIIPLTSAPLAQQIQTKAPGLEKLLAAIEDSRGKTAAALTAGVNAIDQELSS